MRLADGFRSQLKPLLTQVHWLLQISELRIEPDPKVFQGGLGVSQNPEQGGGFIRLITGMPQVLES